jgi:hypothetical protein
MSRTPFTISSFTVSRHHIPLSGLRAPLKVVQLSDLHVGHVHRPRQARRWVRAALNLAPDVIVITGDFVDKPIPEVDLRQLVEALSELQAPLGVFAVPGNHDYGSFTPHLTRLTDPLEAAGVRFLINSNVALRPDVVLAGVDDLWLGKPDLPKALEGVPDGVAVLLLAHHPDQLIDVPLRVGLTLSGHTHGGQVVLPWLGALHTGSDYGQRFAQGLVLASGPGSARGFVSRGLGTTFLPLRFGCPAEMVVLNLEPE